jgi:ABC-type multidrug transport system ATPase subunit
MRAAEPSLRRRVGFLPGDLALFAHATGAETLDLFAALYGVPCPDRNDVLARFRFPHRRSSGP